MRHGWIATLLLGVATPAFSQVASAPPSPPASFESLVPAIDAHFRDFMAEEHVPGLVYGIVRDGRLIHVGAMGVQDQEQRRPVGADSLFRIASMSKAFTALAILKLRNEGRLRLDALAEDYVPEMRGWRYPTSDSPHIRVRDLLSHVGGFVTDDPWGDRQTPMPEKDFDRILRDGVPFSRVPQTRYEYSNFGYALLGRIIANVSGTTYKDYVEQQIMRPLGMASTGYDIFAAPPERRALGYRWENEALHREPDMGHGAFAAIGGVQTSANDYARWVAFLLSAWPARDGAEQAPVRRATVRELAQGLNFVRMRDRPVLKDDEPCRAAAAYAMAFFVTQDCRLGTTLDHGGGYPGYGSFVFLLPEYGVGVFAFSNHTYSGPRVPVLRAVREMEKAGLFVSRALPVSDALSAMYGLAGDVYRAGNLQPARGALAMNVLMDRSEQNWAAELARLKRDAGECATRSPITATGALSGRFSWVCARATIEGTLLLAPTSPPSIQALRLNTVAAK